jgi:hypothetical protein
LGEEVYIMEGHYYDTRGRVIAGPGTHMFNASGAVHGGIRCDLTFFIHRCSGEPDEIVAGDLIDFTPGRQMECATRRRSRDEMNRADNGRDACRAVNRRDGIIAAEAEALPPFGMARASRSGSRKSR